MVDTREMPRDKQINFRVSEDEAKRFDAVAEHYSLSLAAMLRMLVKREVDQIAAKKAAIANVDDFRWADRYEHILGVVKQSNEPVDASVIGVALTEGAAGVVYLTPIVGLGRWLNDLVRNGYLRRTKAGYVTTPKGDAVLD